MSTDQLLQKLVETTRAFNDKRIARQKRDTLIPVAAAIRAELARRGRVVSVEELALLCNS
jgi:hypothetical protein